MSEPTEQPRCKCGSFKLKIGDTLSGPDGLVRPMLGCDACGETQRPTITDEALDLVYREWGGRYHMVAHRERQQRPEDRIAELELQLAEVTKERDQLRAMAILVIPGDPDDEREVRELLSARLSEARSL